MRKIGREIKDKILPYVDSLTSSIEKMHFIKKINDVSGIPISALEDDLKKDMKELFYNLKEEHLKEKLGQKMRELYLAEESEDHPKSSQILKEINDINNEIQNIKNNRTKKYESR